MMPGEPRPPRPLPLAAAIVPARIGSTRLPRKMLLRDTGQYLFEHTARNAERAGVFGGVWVATDSDELLRAAEDVGVRAVATSPAHPSGTDRVREAVDLLTASGDLTGDEVVVNVQGDEPELSAEDLAALVAAFADEEVEAATLWAPLIDAEELSSPSVVKVVCDSRGWALYFSRAAIPLRAHPGAAPGDPVEGRRHVGVYAFRPAALRRFCDLPRSTLERTENLEQLRWLEAGEHMLTVRATIAPHGIDTEDDYAQFVRRIGQLEETRTS